VDGLIAIHAKKILKPVERNASLAEDKKEKIELNTLPAVQLLLNVQEKVRVRLGEKLNDKTRRFN
jgi:hypothetical protein